MSKKPFWRRVNRGFVVSMALLAAVLIYVLVTQLMLIPERSQIKKLSDEFREIVEDVSMLTNEQTEGLQNEGALVAEAKKLKNELSKLFVKDSGYVDETINNLTEIIKNQVKNSERITKRSEGIKYKSSNKIDQDVGEYFSDYIYTVSGEYMDLITESSKKISDAKQHLYINITCKKIDGEWKIYRVGTASWDSLVHLG